MQARAHELAGKRGNTLLFTGINFVVMSGEGLTITGSNGVGKSTLLRILAGLLPAQAGQFTLETANGTSLSISDEVHYLGHRNGMKRELTVYENLSFWKKFQAGDEDDGLEIDEAIARVELDGIAHLPFEYLSAGQQRRIALARLLVAARPLWLLDEPTAALDKRSERLFGDIASQHLGEGGMLIAATHLPLEIPNITTIEITPAGHSDDQQAGIWL